MGLLSKKRAPEWTAVARIADFRNTLMVVVNQKEYCLYKLGDGIYCTQNSCSHEYSPLSEGMIEGDEVFCPKHGSRFDIRTGAVRNLPATESISTYPVRVEGDEISILV